MHKLQTIPKGRDRERYEELLEDMRRSYAWRKMQEDELRERLSETPPPDRCPFSGQVYGDEI